MPVATFEPQKQTLGQILSSTSPPIRVPDYQRDYSWQLKQIREFWSDLLGFERQFPGREIDGKEYFLGSSVLVRTGSHCLLLDGQQRFATATILLACIRNRVHRYNTNAARQIQESFIAFENHLAGGSRTYKIELNIYDRQFFREAVQDWPASSPTPAPTPRQQSHRTILTAKKLFQRQLDDLWKDATTPAAAFDHALRLAKVLTNHFAVVVVSSNDEDHAASIFETLNDRGIGLSTADLLRSWLLKEADPTTRDEITRLWGEIFAAAGKEKVENVIRVSWIARNGDEKSRTLYKVIKDRLRTDSRSCLSFTQELHADAKHFKLISNASTGTPALDEVCRGLRSLKATSAYAPLIACRGRFSPPDQNRFAQAIASLVIRHNVVCHRDRSKFESVAFAASKAITEGASCDAALAMFRALSPNDAEFKASFSRLRFGVSQHPVVQILLRTIENNRAGTGEKIIAKPKKVNIEHIYPQNPPAGERVADHDGLAYRLGNLTLLGDELNRSASNSDFATKKTSMYSKSQFLITRELIGYQTWSASTVSERQDRLCDEALLIWPHALVS